MASGTLEACLYKRLRIFLVSAVLIAGTLLCLVATRSAADVEPNDSFAQAEAITPGTHTGSVGALDPVDFYSVTLTADGEWIFANVTVPGTLTIDLYLYDSSQNEVDSSIGTVGGVGRVDYVFATAQTVYVRIQYIAGAGSYSMDVAVLSQNDANSGGDAGNDFPVATTVTAGTYPGCFLKDQDNADYYELAMTASGQRVYVNVTVPATSTVDVYLYDQSHIELASVIGTVGGTATIDYAVDLMQNLFVRVQLTAGSGTYVLQLAMANQNDANSGGDAGNDFPVATTVIAGTYPGCFLKDQDNADYYKSVLTIPGTVYANVTVPAALTVDLYLYDQSHGEMSSDIGVVGGTARVTYDFTTAQTVFVRIQMTAGWGTYTLQLDVPGADTTPPTITHTPVTTALVGQVTSITATVTDNSQVDSVYLNYTNVAGTNSNVSMTKSGNDYSYNIPAQTAAGTVTYFIWANDTSDNERRTPVYTITVSADTTPPMMTHTPVTSANAGEAITITATITDNVGVQSATLYYRKTGDTAYTSVAMVAAGSTYTAVIPASAVTTAGIQYYISATDGTNTATAPAANPTTTPYSVSVTEQGGLPWLWIIIIIVIVVVIALVAVLMRKKKKVPAQTAQPPQGQTGP